MSQRFTIDGSSALESHLAATCERVLAGVKSLVPAAKLDGILLGGGYGRGEGGVLKTSAGDQPYNDLEFYVFVRGHAILAERKFRHPLHELGENLLPEAGLEVEFKVLTLEKLRRSRPSMFYYDLVAGHRWQLGDDKLLADCVQHRDAAKIPLHEVTRLLMNRCSGLLYAAERLVRTNFSEAEADFVGRNLAKAQLAFGDVLLAANGQYHWSCRERHVRLAQLTAAEHLPLTDFIRHHAAGVQFKLHPTRSTESRDILSARHAELSELGQNLWLWLETKRLETNFATPREYALSEINKCPETSAGRNRLVNFRQFGVRGLMCEHYPRERLFHALALLLWTRNAQPETAWQRAVQSNLDTSAVSFPAMVDAYTRLWSRFN